MRIKIYVTRGTVDHDDFHENLSQRGFDVPILLQKRSPWRLTLFFVLFFSFFSKKYELIMSEMWETIFTRNTVWNRAENLRKYCTCEIKIRNDFLDRPKSVYCLITTKSQNVKYWTFCSSRRAVSLNIAFKKWLRLLLNLAEGLNYNQKQIVYW